MAFGFATNLIAESYEFNFVEQAAHAHQMIPSWLSIGSAAVLIFIAIPPLRGLLIKPTTEKRLGSEAV